MNVKRGSSFGPYVVAVLSVTLAAFATCYLQSLRDIHSMALWMIAVVVTLFYGGFYPSLLATGLSAALFDYLIAPPTGWGMNQPEDRIRLASFVVIAILFSFLFSQRVDAEAKARSMLQRLTLAMDGTKQGVWDLDLRTGVVWHSVALEETFARGPDRFAQSYEVFLGYVHAEDRDFVHRTVTHSIESGEEYHIQYRINRPSGEERWVSTRGRVFYDEKRHPERLVAVTADITNQPGASLPPSAPLFRPTSPLNGSSAPIIPAVPSAAAGIA
jgi:PAS domain S-box-containing protein